MGFHFIIAIIHIYRFKLQLIKLKIISYQTILSIFSFSIIVNKDQSSCAILSFNYTLFYILINRHLINLIALRIFCLFLV